MAAGTARENNRFKDLVPINRHYNGTLRIVLGKGLSYFLIYILVAFYVLYIVPRIFSLNQIGQPYSLVSVSYTHLREELIGVNAGIVKSVAQNILKYSPNAILVVISNPMDTMTYLSLKSLGLPKNRIIGMGGALDSSCLLYTSH